MLVIVLENVRLKVTMGRVQTYQGRVRVHLYVRRGEEGQITEENTHKSNQLAQITEDTYQ